MKKSILTINAMALCLLSCSSGGQDDAFVPEPSPTPDEPTLTGIAFGGDGGAWHDAPTTRATTTGLQTLFPSFKVWGYKNNGGIVMNGYQVAYRENSVGSTVTNTAGWEYVGIENADINAQQTVKYWDYSATDYRFMAYAPADAEGVTTKETDGKRIIVVPYTYSEHAETNTTPYVSEMWYATDHKQYGNRVALTFAPIIAKVRFKFTYPDDISTIHITDIKFQDSRDEAEVPQNGIITATYPVTTSPTGSEPQLGWQEAETPRTAPLVLDTPYEDVNDRIHILNEEQYGKWYYVPPMNLIPYEQGAYTITACINGKTSTASVPAAYMQWKAGYQYTYIFKITEAGTYITFMNLQVEQWVDGDNVDNGGKGTEGW